MKWRCLSFWDLWTTDKRIINPVSLLQAIGFDRQRWQRWFKPMGLIGLGIVLSLLLHTALPAIATPPPAPSSLSSLIQTGKIAYQNGQYQEAADSLAQAVQLASEQGSVLNQALVLSYLALTYQQLGQLEDAKTAISQSMSLLPATGGNADQRQVRAQVLNTQGRLQLAWGQTEAALESWQSAEADYRAVDDDEGTIGSQINQIQALRSLGFYRRAQDQIQEIEGVLASHPNAHMQMMGWRSLGNILRAIGNLDESYAALEQSRQLAISLPDVQGEAIALLELGNTEKARGDRLFKQQLLENQESLTGDTSYCPVGTVEAEAASRYQQADRHYQESANITPSAITWVQAKLNHLNLQVRLEQPSDPNELQQIQARLNALPLSRPALYASVNFAKNLICSHQTITPDSEVFKQAVQILGTAIQNASMLDDARAESYASGNLGHLYESENELSKAKEYTLNALRVVPPIQAPDISYQWQWQMGRILRQEGDRLAALNYYAASFDALKGLRDSLVALDTDIQFSFRESVEPVYRQYTELLLQDPNQNNLKQARDVIDALQLAELDNFFQDACSDAEIIPADEIVDQKDPTAAIFYSIILPDRLAVIVKLPQEETLQYYFTNISSDEVKQVLRDLHTELKQRGSSEDIRRLATKVYSWLIQPAEVWLAERQIETLLFVSDGYLKNIPMAVLYDQNSSQHLIQKYAVALSPRLQVLDPKPIREVTLNALLGGLSESDDFNNLPYVVGELTDIQNLIPTVTNEPLLNHQFTQENIESIINSTPVSIVHLATHAQFSSQSEETFILFHGDKKLNIEQLKTLLGSRNIAAPGDIELLVLSACETATGDERAALGLAGIAVRAGARSTLASLWRVGDESTPKIMSEFYEQLQNSQELSKAKALQRAQRMFLEENNGNGLYKHPFDWAPYVLLGNWL